MKRMLCLFTKKIVCVHTFDQISCKKKKPCITVLVFFNGCTSSLTLSAISEIPTRYDSLKVPTKGATPLVQPNIVQGMRQYIHHIHVHVSCHVSHINHRECKVSMIFSV